jgi:DNA sulfur modification protein DndE
MALEHIRVSQEGREQLIKLKRVTGIEHWNVLCRWAFCLSLREPSLPPSITIGGDSSVEMSWKTFGGSAADVYWGLLQLRCVKDGLPLTNDELARQFRLHLHRGIAMLSRDRGLRNVADLLRRVA